MRWLTRLLLSLLLALVVVRPGLARSDIPPEEVTPRRPSWATPAWREYAAHIVASEARGVPQADIVVACTLIRDIERGWPPWGLHPGRWHGWGSPDSADRQAVEDALNGACADVPNYIYVGNFQDAQFWARIGTIKGWPVDLYVGPSGAAVVGVPAKEISDGKGYSKGQENHEAADRRLQLSYADGCPDQVRHQAQTSRQN